MQYLGQLHGNIAGVVAEIRISGLFKHKRYLFCTGSAESCEDMTYAVFQTVFDELT
ncbi:hypothetical protein D3C80_1347760 [compost metagenome]